MTERISHEDMGFGDIQVEEKPKSNAPATEAVAPPASQPVMPSASQPLPTKAVAAPAVAPPLPPMPAAKSKVTAKDILPPLPNMPDVTKDPAFIKNAETAGAIGAGTVGLMTLLGIGGAALTAHLAKKYGAKPETPSGPELTYTPPQAPVAETPVAETPVTETPKQTIQNRTFSPKEAAVASNITDNYPFSLQEAKNGLGIGDVKITDSTQAKLVADQYAKQLQAQAAANAPAVTPTETPTPPPAPTAAAPIERYVFTAEGLQKANPGQTEWEIGSKTFDAQEYADYLNDKFKSALESKTPTSAAEVPKTPLIVEAPAPATPAPPPAEVPQAAVPPTEEKLTKQQKGMKGHLVAMYGGGHEGEAAYGKVKEILGYTPEYPPGKGGSLSAQETQILKDWRKANMAGPKINLTHDMKKTMTSGTTLAVLMSIPAFAEAAQNKNYGEMTNIATDLLVLPFAQSRATGENEQYELAKRRYEGMVGGGRGVTPAQAYNVGAGRGVAPPSAYQR